MSDLPQQFLEACRYANATPALLSMLYDIGLMPEQARSDGAQARLIAIAAHWRNAMGSACRSESDCGWQPWCRINGKCKRDAPSGGRSP